MCMARRELCHGGRNEVEEKARSGPVSRILYSLPSEDHSSVTRVTAVIEQPTRKLFSETGGSIASLFGLAPQGVCLAIRTHAGRGALLPHHFTLTAIQDEPEPRRYLSVALSVAFPRLDVIQPAARWSSDFPPCLAAQRSSGPLRRTIITRAAGLSWGRSGGPPLSARLAEH